MRSRITTSKALASALPVTPSAYGTDDQFFGRHERQLVGKAAPDARRMHLQSANDVLHQHENGVGCKERLGNDKTAVGAVVERALEVLHTVRLIGVRLEAENEAGEGIDPLAAHRVALVRHRGREPASRAWLAGRPWSAARAAGESIRASAHHAIRERKRRGPEARAGLSRAIARGRVASGSSQYCR